MTDENQNEELPQKRWKVSVKATGQFTHNTGGEFIATTREEAIEHGKTQLKGELNDISETGIETWNVVADEVVEEEQAA